MGFLSGLGRTLRQIGQNVPMAQAALAGDYGGMASMRAQQDRTRAAQAEAEMEAQLRAQAAAALAARGYSKSDIGGLRPEDVSQLIREDLITRQFTSAGGTTARRDPRTNTTNYEQAPWREQVGRAIVEGGNGRDPSVAFESVEPVAVPDVGVFGWNHQGPVNGTGQVQQPQQQPSNIPSGSPLDPNLARPTASAGGYADGVASVLASAGMPAPVVAGIIGNGHQESGWNASATGDGGTAHGALQWRGERVANFQRITGAHPSNASPEQTAQFIMWELQNPEAAGMTRQQASEILSAQTPAQAATLFSRYYERPSARHANNETRAGYAEQFAQAGGIPNMPGQPQMASDMPQPLIPTGRRPPPGYENAPGGLRAVPGGPGDNTYQRQREGAQDRRQINQDAGQVLQQFRGDPVVQQFQQARTSVFQLRNLRDQNTPAAQMGMIFQLMKTLDPGSTVREGEYASVRNTAGWPEQWRQMLEQVQSGRLLSTRQMQDIVRTAENLYTERARVYNERAEDFRRQALAMDIPPQRVGQMFPTANAPRSADRQRQEQQRQRPQRQGAQQGWQTTPSGRRYRIGQ